MEPQEGMSLSGSEFKTGDFVICINNEAKYPLALTKGKVYNVVKGEYRQKKFDTPMIKIILDDGNEFGAYTHRFKLAPQMKTKLGELW